MHASQAHGKVPEMHCRTDWSKACSWRQVSHRSRASAFPGGLQIRTTYLTRRRIGALSCCSGPRHTERGTSGVCIAGNDPRLFEKWREWLAHTFKANGIKFSDEFQTN
jgi:hypothetical protein